MDFRLLPLILAPFIGSFLGVLILRLPEARPIAWVRSACSHCGTRLAAWEMIPILSWLALRGHCRHCGSRIDALHFQVELAALAVAATAALSTHEPAWLWADCLLGCGLLALAWIDARSLLLPDVVTLPLLLAGLGATWWLQPEAILDHAIAAGLGWLGLALLAAAFRRLRGKDGLGGGDAKLLGVGGAWLGLAALPAVLLLAAMFGLTLVLARHLIGHRIGRATPLPFGPALALAIWLARLSL